MYYRNLNNFQSLIQALIQERRFRAWWLIATFFPHISVICHFNTRLQCHSTPGECFTKTKTDLKSDLTMAGRPCHYLLSPLWSWDNIFSFNNEPSKKMKFCRFVTTISLKKPMSGMLRGTSGMNSPTSIRSSLCETPPRYLCSPPSWFLASSRPSTFYLSL